MPNKKKPRANPPSANPTAQDAASGQKDEPQEVHPPEPAPDADSKDHVAEPSSEAGNQAEPRSCLVVGIGASAGGLEAISEVLHELPEDLGAAVVLIQHLDPKHSSMLGELLARSTRMPVQQVIDGEKVQPNHVYVITPNTCIAIRKGALYNEPRHPTMPHMPIDYFFRSLAEEQRGNAVGVVLSGTASDGTLGLKAIKEAGGITIAQEPETARYDGMPRSAIAAGCVDAVLKPKAIAAELVRLCRHAYLTRAGSAENLPQHEPGFDEIMTILRTVKGVDFTHYKPGTVRRRTLRRMAIHRLETTAQYAAYIRTHREELDHLMNDILIHVTSFFREPDTFAAITNHVLPALMAGRSHDDPVRVWVPGCATGEEAYSIAICLLEYMRKTNQELPIQIFGTDLSDLVLETARTGIYPRSIEADVSPERLRRFFVQTNGTYQISRSVRDTCVFARHNVTKDPPFSKLDLVVCRNLLIYLGPRLQIKVMRLFHYALKPNCFLVLGASETASTAGDFFSPIDRHNKIFSRNAKPPIIATDFAAYDERSEAFEITRRPPVVVEVPHDRRIEQTILARYAPPSVVLDADLKIIQFRGDTSPYLQHASGTASLNLGTLARGNLGVEIRKLIQSPEIKSGVVKSEPVTMRLDGAEKGIRLTVVPLLGGPDPQYLVAFEKPAADLVVTSSVSREPSASSELPERVRELEEELTNTKRYLHSVIEEQEAATEELKSAHEEVQSSNEELQSTNEELLTAKEELQSTNEELTTVNDEMQSRNLELQQINNDWSNLLTSVHIPIIMLGSDLRIRRFTPHGERILNLLPTDVGRPIDDLRLKINVPDLKELCTHVIDSLVPREREVHDNEGRIYTMWIRPYRTTDNRIDGVVLALVDITDRKETAEVRYKRLFEASKDGIVIADALTGEIVDSNPAVTGMFGYPRNSLICVKFWDSDLFRNSAINESTRRELLDRESLQMSLMLVSDVAAQVPVDITASLYSESNKKAIQFNIRDVAARIQMEEKLRRSEEELRGNEKMEAIGRLAGGVAHDFNNILTAIVGYTDLLRPHVEHDPRGIQMLDSIRTGADRAVALTRQLLAFGRKQIVNPTRLDPNTVIGEMRQVLAVMMTKGVDLHLNLEESAGHVLADRTQFEQIILNLVLNARDAMPDGGTIAISTANIKVDQSFSERHPTVPAGDYVAVTVRDTGRGMDKETQSHIFEPFFTTKTKGGGVGLGLATVYNIVKQSGGYIWAYSELGVGTTFRAYLPRIAAETAERSKVQEPAEPKGTETILLVEDESAVRHLVRRFLDMRGYKVLEAGDAPEALRMSREYPETIHLMVTDVVMPRMSGRELALQLASERPDMNVLYMSGHTEDAIVHHGVLKKGLEFLQKPFTQQEFTSRVRHILDARPQSASESLPEDGNR
ncbi:MAG: chemotaxis protein CheB [Bryobacteraceae bacterium]